MFNDCKDSAEAAESSVLIFTRGTWPTGQVESVENGAKIERERDFMFPKTSSSLGLDSTLYTTIVHFDFVWYKGVWKVDINVVNSM